MRTAKVALLSVIVVLGALCSGCATLQKTAPREITVLGVAEVVVPPDFVTVRASVVTLNKDVEKAQAENDKKVKAVLSFVRKLGVAPKDIRTEYTSLRPKERRERNKPPVFEGYEASNSITVVLRDMSKYDELLSGVLKLGVNRISGITFRSTQEIKKRREARLLAIQAAREKAEYLASALGQTVGRPRWITEFRRERRPWGSIASNVAWVSPSLSQARADTKEGTLAPGSTTIRAQVEVCFALDD